jgi:hypothetical protein
MVNETLGRAEITSFTIKAFESSFPRVSSVTNIRKTAIDRQSQNRKMSVSKKEEERKKGNIPDSSAIVLSEDTLLHTRTTSLLHLHHTLSLRPPAYRVCLGLLNGLLTPGTFTCGQNYLRRALGSISVKRRIRQQPLLIMSRVGAIDHTPMRR